MPKICLAVVLFVVLSQDVLATNRRPLFPPYFGHAIAVHGDLVLIGAPNADNSKGRAYLFRRERSGHRLLAVVEPTSRFGRHNFGADVALDGRTIIIGDGLASSGFTSGAGATFVYDMPKVGELGEKPLRLIPTKPERLAGFGDSIAFTGNLLAVGEFARNDGGSVTLFRRKKNDEWLRQSTLNATQLDVPSMSVAWYGVDVAADQAALVVGAPWTKFDDVMLGAVFLYDTTDDQSIDTPAMLSWKDRTRHDFFGNQVAIEKDIIVVGAGLARTSGVEDSGAACVYVRGRDGRFPVEPTTVLTSSKPTKREHFGSVLAVTGRRIVIGTSGEHGVYVFEPVVGDEDKWTQVAHLTGNAPPSGFGGSGLGATETHVYVGEPYKQPNGEHNGQVAVFARTEKNGKVTFRRIETIAMPN